MKCMCGFLAIVNTDGRALDQEDEELLHQLSLRHQARGPDGYAVKVTQNAGFAHNRLAIRDKQQGQQPWESDDGRWVLVYNGELYNDGDLRRELAASHTFRTRCDTEVVLAAFLRWGRECVKHLHGMFALAVYDTVEDTLWMARDRFGIKPLFFAEIGGQFIVASSVAAIVSHPRFLKRPNWQAISHYLSTSRLTFAAETLYAGVSSLPPSHVLSLSRGRLRLSRYWDYPRVQEAASYEESTQRLRSHLAESVQQRLVSDVPVGMFLSGGVDSSMIAALLHRGGADCRYATCAAYQSTTDAPETREQHFAQLCANHVQVDLEAVKLDQAQYRRRWLDLVRRFQLPLTTPSDVLIYEIAKTAKRRVGVVLGGEGSDELFCGYEVAHWAGYDYDASVALGAGGGNASIFQSIVRQYGRSRFASEADHYFALNSLLPTHQKHAVLHPHVLNEIDNDLAMYRCYQDLYDAYEGSSTVEKNAILLHRHNLESLLMRLDACTMAAGLEARVPFTDHTLVEAIFQLPYHYRIDAVDPVTARSFASAELAQAGRLRPKRMLRDVARDLLPSVLADRKKQSFPTGVQEWFQRDWTTLIANYLLESPFARELLCPRFQTELVAQPHLAGMWLWPITNLSLWGDAEFFGVSPSNLDRAA